jgi:UTP-glucose-1-phosphate uridylyltransferase
MLMKPNVIIAAGGLGTRIHEWARFIPKEFLPIGNQPGVVHLLEEISALGPSHAYFVHHPYYEPFIGWINHLLHEGGLGRYGAALAAQGKSTKPVKFKDIDITFVSQSHSYSDVGALFSCLGHIKGQAAYVIFADMLYLPHKPLGLLKKSSGKAPLVMGRKFDIGNVANQGVIVTRAEPGGQRIVDIIEKPTRAQALKIAKAHGDQNLFMLEGRFWLTPEFIGAIVPEDCLKNGEPKLAYALRNYAQGKPAYVVPFDAQLTHFGAEAL